MELKGYSLNFKDNVLFENVNTIFEKNIIHHLLGKNGSGKSAFAKSILGAVDYKGIIDLDNKRPVVIGSYTNIPLEYKVKDILNILDSRSSSKFYKKLEETLDIASIPYGNKLGSLSDGQKQKIKLLFFFANRPKMVVLDEFTTALDKKTSIEVYNFLNHYIKNFDSTIINITHNLSDLKNMPGKHYIINNKNIFADIDMKTAVDFYIGGVNYEK